MLLADWEISRAIETGDLLIEPFDEEMMLQPASVDLQLGDYFVTYLANSGRVLDPCRLDDLAADVVTWGPTEQFILEPGGFVLAHTIQRIYVPLTLAARIEGKSTLGRLGLQVHSTAGFVDPGFSGQLTLEIGNLNPRSILLHKGMWIAQLSFMRVSMPHVPYGTTEAGSHYQNQTGVRLPSSLAPFQKELV